MTDYFAFLRGINVGGKNSIKMEDLRHIFEDCGFENVKSYIQSGNILFSYKKDDPHELVRKIEGQIIKSAGLEIPVIVRTRDQLDTMLKSDPFKGKAINDKSKPYVVFLSSKPTISLPLPLFSEKDGLELLSIVNEDAFLLSFPVGDHSGFPNAFMEKKYKVAATSRYWHVVMKMLEL
jgi:uncharacterized protein (DUF1697 family)